MAEKAAANVNLNTCCIYGGVERHTQRTALAKGVHMMVATPGRLLSLINDGEISLARVTFIVLDEADRMLDLGFEPVSSQPRTAGRTGAFFVQASYPCWCSSERV